MTRLNIGKILKRFPLLGQYLHTSQVQTHSYTSTLDQYLHTSQVHTHSYTSTLGQYLHTSQVQTHSYTSTEVSSDTEPIIKTN